MITFICGNKGKSLIAIGLQKVFECKNMKTYIFHEGAGVDIILKYSKNHDHIIVCFNDPALFQIVREKIKPDYSIYTTDQSVYFGTPKNLEKLRS